VSWLNRLFGKKTAPLEPWSFPHRIDGLADSLALTVFEHEMAALGCWVMVRKSWCSPWRGLAASTPKASPTKWRAS